jgi:hypothetical protein
LTWVFLPENLSVHDNRRTKRQPGGGGFVSHAAIANWFVRYRTVISPETPGFSA